MKQWHYDGVLNVLVCRLETKQGSGNYYYIDLDRCSNNAAILDWIIQVSKKRWATSEIVGDLVISLNEILDIQGTFCSGASINPRRLL
jgi:hypothetical protein